MADIHHTTLSVSFSGICMFFILNGSIAVLMVNETFFIIAMETDFRQFSLEYLSKTTSEPLS